MTGTQTKFAVDGVAKAEPKAEDKSPSFSVKAKGFDGFVGSAWLNDGKYGKYISVKTRVELPAGSTLYLSPTKKAGKILG